MRKFDNNARKQRRESREFRKSRRVTRWHRRFCTRSPTKCDTHVRNTVTGRSRQPDISANKADDCEEKPTIARFRALLVRAFAKRRLHAQQFALRSRILLLSPERLTDQRCVVIVLRSRSSPPANVRYYTFYRKMRAVYDISLRGRYFISRCFVRGATTGCVVSDDSSNEKRRR